MAPPPPWHWGPIGPLTFLCLGTLERTAQNAWGFLLHSPRVFLVHLMMPILLLLVEQNPLVGVAAALSNRLRSLPSSCWGTLLFSDMKSLGGGGGGFLRPGLGGVLALGNLSSRGDFGSSHNTWLILVLLDGVIFEGQR